MAAAREMGRTDRDLFFTFLFLLTYFTVTIFHFVEQKTGMGVEIFFANLIQHYIFEHIREHYTGYGNTVFTLFLFFFLLLELYFSSL